ncbi:hypothetical protein AVEN_124949-1 [Araneus ventricosus]|uniref:Uncharacterized protein n=1 Tax=Araneus ventricosus TaxID=182803 RepID=A0A4Y2W9A2_ARAVE|nr:hypothetical protein AVEN_124949-1 [Araneus ventricosus]
MVAQKSIKALHAFTHDGTSSLKIRMATSEQVLVLCPRMVSSRKANHHNGRYVSAPEAMWRLNEFNLSEKSHTVVRLAVRLPDQQAIAYQDGQEEEAVARAATRQTTLTAWFELNKNDQDSHIYLYTDISSLLYF